MVAVFDGLAAAEQAKMRLLRSGVQADRIVLSAQLTADAIAAEAPGQSYENQHYRGSDRVSFVDWVRGLIGRKPSTDTDRSRYNESVRSGGCLLSVEIGSARERTAAKHLLEQAGARIAMERPA